MSGYHRSQWQLSLTNIHWISQICPFSSISIPPPFSTKQNVIISYIAPTLTPEGDPLETGYLWWSPLTGKMYIYYRDTDGNNSWVITNPVGMLSTPYSLDNIPDGDGGVILPPVTPLPIPPLDGEGGQNLGVNYKRVNPSFGLNILRILYLGILSSLGVGAPGTGLEEICVINRILETHVPAAAVIDRSNTVSEILDGTPVLNVSKSLYTVTCDNSPHNLTNKDLFTLSGSAYDEVNEENSSQLVRFT